LICSFNINDERLCRFRTTFRRLLRSNDKAKVRQHAQQFSVGTLDYRPTSNHDDSWVLQEAVIPYGKKTDVKNSSKTPNRGDLFRIVLQCSKMSWRQSIPDN
jgi:hypothetical protein